MATRTALPRSLLALRLSVFLVMFMWTLDKFVNPEHAMKVYENFYGLGGVGGALMLTRLDGSVSSANRTHEFRRAALRPGSRQPHYR